MHQWINSALAFIEHWKRALMGPLFTIVLLFSERATGPLSKGWFVALIFAALAWQFYSDLRDARKPKESPTVVLKKNSFRCAIRPIQGTDKQICSLVCDFENVAEHHETEKAHAKDVFAKLLFYNIDVEQSPKFLFEVEGRWARNHEPGQGKITKEILATDIRVGETAQLDIANRYVDQLEAFAVDNESAWFGFQKPEQKLEGEKFLVRVKLVGVGVKTKCEFRFENRGKYDYLAPLN